MLSSYTSLIHSRTLIVHFCFFTCVFILRSAHAQVQPRDRTVVPTGIAVAVPGGTYGRVAPRSGLAAKSGIDVGAGVVDADYRGELKVVLFNHSDEPLYVKPGDRIAQLVLERIACASVHEVDDLDATDRSADGFGSTGA